MSLIDDLKWLGKTEEVEFEKHKFRGKLAGKSWKYSQYLNGMIRTRAIILIMSILVYYPIITNYLYYDFFSLGLLIERIVYSVMFIIAGLFFNKYRIFSIVIATIALVLILLGYLFAGNFHLYKIGFIGAILIFVLLGLYQHINLKRIKKELEANLLENQLIDDNR